MSPDAVVVGVCIGISVLVTVLCGLQVRQAERRADAAEELLRQTARQADELDVLCRKQGRLIQDMRAHIEETGNAWVVYQREHRFRPLTAVQVIRVWEN